MQFKVGQKVVVAYIEDSGRKPNVVTNNVVEKVGRKYFYLSGINAKFHIETNRSDSEFSYHYEAYSDMSEYEELKRKKSLIKIVKCALSNFRMMNNIDYDKAKKLAEVLGINEE